LPNIELAIATSRRRALPRPTTFPTLSTMIATLDLRPKLLLYFAPICHTVL
jgi:hypothetical protein